MSFQECLKELPPPTCPRQIFAWSVEAHNCVNFKLGNFHRATGIRINARIFAITAICALAHLVVHTLWLSVITTFLPALGASLHGALAQSEAYRLAVTSERLDGDLRASIERIEAAQAASGADAEEGIRTAVRAAIGVILEEHQDWHMLVRPHHLPLG